MNMKSLTPSCAHLEVSTLLLIWWRQVVLKVSLWILHFVSSFPWHQVEIISSALSYEKGRPHFLIRALLFPRPRALKIGWIRILISPSNTSVSTTETLPATPPLWKYRTVEMLLLERYLFDNKWVLEPYEIEKEMNLDAILQRWRCIIRRGGERRMTLFTLSHQTPTTTC